MLHALAAAAFAQDVACRGDCNGDGEVTVDELIKALNIALGNAAVSECPALLDCPEIDVVCLIGAVNNALLGCSVPATPTATPSERPSPSATAEVTNTPTPTEPVGTSTPTDTMVPTPSPSPTATVTPSPTTSPSLSASPSVTPTPSITITPSRTATPTRSRTPTQTWTSTRTPSPTWSATSTRPPTRTPTGTSTRTATRTWTPTPTVTNTATQTLTPTASRTATWTRTPTATITATATLPPTPTVPIVAGPQITFFGLATASGHRLTPVDVTPEGSPIYQPLFGAGFIIVVESKSGSSGKAPGVKTLNSSLTDPSARPDIQIEANRALGNGSAAVCDIGPAPNQPIGGIPGINPPSFDPTSQMVADALNDFGCRLDSHTASDPCTLTDNDIPRLVASDTSTQFCTAGVVGHEVEFPQGDTLLTVQWRDTATVPNLSLPRQIIVRVP
jgi:hypothetical protein